MHWGLSGGENGSDQERVLQEKIFIRNPSLQMSASNLGFGFRKRSSKAALCLPQIWLHSGSSKQRIAYAHNPAAKKGSWMADVGTRSGSAPLHLPIEMKERQR